MKVKYFDDNDNEIFPKYDETMTGDYGNKLYYLNTWQRKPKIHQVYRIREIKPVLSENSFIYKITDYNYKEFWADENELYTNKKEVFDKAIELDNRRKIKFIGR